MSSDTPQATTVRLPQASQTSARSTALARRSPTNPTRTASASFPHNPSTTTGSATRHIPTTHKTRDIRKITSNTRRRCRGASRSKSAPTRLPVSTVVLPRTSDVTRETTTTSHNTTLHATQFSFIQLFLKVSAFILYQYLCKVYLPEGFGTKTIKRPKLYTLFIIQFLHENFRFKEFSV